jgi:phosphatidylglycerophosphate synthase
MTGVANLRILSKYFIDGFYAVINPIGEILESAEVHPHFVTGTGLVFSAFSGLLFWNGHIFSGGVLLIMAGACDALDGRLARNTDTMSNFGALLDSTVDRYSEIFVFMGLAAFFNTPFMAALILMAVAGSLLTSYTRARAEGLNIECKAGMMQRPERVAFIAVGAIIGSIIDLIFGSQQVLLKLAILGIAVIGNITVIQRMLIVKKSLDDNIES